MFLLHHFFIVSSWSRISSRPTFFYLVLSIVFWTTDCVIACLFLRCNAQNHLNCNGHKNTCRIEKPHRCKVILQYVAAAWDESRNFGLKAIRRGKNCNCMLGTDGREKWVDIELKWESSRLTAKVRPSWNIDLETLSKFIIYISRFSNLWNFHLVMNVHLKLFHFF